MKGYSLSVLLLFSASLTSCGGGGGGTTAPATDVQILTQTLDQGNVGHAVFQQMTANGGVEPYFWWVSTSGDALPAGLDLTQDGRLAGIPTGSASRTIVMVCQDATSTLDVVSLRIEVRDVEITLSVEGQVDPGQSVFLSASGGNPAYSFALQTNASGASLSSSGSYTAGQDAGVDVVRVTDVDGFFDDLAVTVGSDVFIGFTARWGTHDNWWINWDVVYDPAPAYASDFDEVLVALGLRDPASTDATGTEADQLARALLERRTLGYLSRYYGNGDDGNPQTGGLSISFIGPAGPDSGISPNVGGILGAAPNRFSQICVRHGPDQGVVGTAWLDGGNFNVEHNCGTPNGTSLGVFANRVLSPYLSSFRNSIAGNPVAAGDVDGLRHLLGGGAPRSGREQAMFNVADGFGRILAAVLAHEIGHSLGLNHSSPSDGPSDIMNASLSVGPSIQYGFNGTHWADLLTNLPGPNR